MARNSSKNHRTKPLSMDNIVWMQICVVLQAFCITSALGFAELRFSVEPSDAVVLKGGPAMLHCSVVQSQGETPAQLTWKHDGVNINFDAEGGRRAFMENGSLYFSQVEHSRSHQPDEGEYQCVASVSGLGAIVSRKAKLTVAYLSKTFSYEPSGGVVYLGDTAMFECHIDGAPEPEVTWYKDEQEIYPGDDSNVVQHLDGVLEVTSVRFSDFGRYYCKAENVERSRETEVVHLEQNGDVTSYEGVPPEFILGPRDKVALEGSIVVFNCGANGRDANSNTPTITWLKEGTTIQISSGEESADADVDTRFSIVGQGSLRIDNVKEEDAGSYTCRAANSEDSIDAEASLTVQVPPRFTLRPQNIVARVKSEVTLECAVTGVPSPQIAWLKNGDVFTPSDYFQLVDGRNLQILGLLESDAGLYQCLASNDVANIQASAQLQVLPQALASSSLDPHAPAAAPADGAPVPRSPASLPSEPEQLSGVIVSRRFVTLSWRLPTHAGAGDITHYSIYWQEEESHRERMLNTTALEANIQHLKPDTRYHFRVSAHNSAGAGPPAEVSVTTQQEVNVPGPPSMLHAWAVSPTSIQLEWEPPLLTNGQITNYKVYYYSTERGDTTTGQQGQEEQDVNSVGTSYTLSGLHKFHEYNVRVVAYNNIGAGAATDEITVTTFSDVPAEPPSNISVETGSSTSLVVRWMPPPKEQQNGLINGYKIRYKERGTGSGTTLTTDGNILSTEIPNLEKGTEYQVRIQASTVNGSGPVSEWILAETYVHDLDESVVPGMPVSLRVRSMTNSIVAQWTPPREQGIMIRGYILGYGIGVPDVYKQVLDSRQRSHTIKNLKPSSSYVISLKAFNNVGEGRPNYETGETREEKEDELPTPMESPMGLKAQVLSSTTIMLTWSDNFLGRNQRITDNRFYTIRYNPKLSRRYKYINSTDLNVHIDDLKPSTEYEFSVKVIKGRRMSTWSLSVFNTTSEAPPATAPRDLTPVAVDNKPHWVTLNWQPPRQPNGQITGYLVFYTTDATQKDRDWVVDGTVGERLSTTIKDLTLGTTYYFKVQARNNKGYGPMSPTVIFRTPGADGTGGGQIPIPDDYGRPNVKNGRKGSTKYRTHEYPTPESEENTEGGKQSLVLWISVGAVCGVLLIGCIIFAVFMCKRNNNRQRKGYKPANKGKALSKPGPKDLKPPDLWMDHDQMELKNLEGGDGMTTLPHDSSSRGSEHGDRQYNPNQEERYQPFKPKPIMISVDHQPPPPRDPIATAITNGHLTIGGPDNPPVIVNPTPIRPMHPRAQYPPQYSSTPRVNAGDMVHQPMAVKPQPQPQSSGAKANNARSPMPVIMPKAPDVVRSNKPDPHAAQHSQHHAAQGGEQNNDMPKSFSTEELSAEMANLEGLMKDLNAITQQEFEC